MLNLLTAVQLHLNQLGGSHYGDTKPLKLNHRFRFGI